MVTGVVEITGETMTLKFAAVAPAGTVTEAGGWAKAGLVLESATVAPPAGAAAARITVFDTVVPAPAICDGESTIVKVWAVNAAFSTFAERYDVVQVSAQGSSVKSVGIDCAHGAPLICR